MVILHTNETFADSHLGDCKIHVDCERVQQNAIQYPS